ncbi:unnamed protein product [Bursaphelenchus okinawaensis]|uniref:Uncharacterized protein n=1 Tax=Bursaphelenchus okinawaensis TaxID=465554 RepID=A0A811LD29_9BILA|nr:unnamed protein product [Bursaphelenchus okinawaensis]CAG9121690.1 unnamed protein product [Bursaphelenchus okinawaensis]
MAWNNKVLFVLLLLYVFCYHGNCKAIKRSSISAENDEFTIDHDFTLRKVTPSKQQTITTSTATAFLKTSTLEVEATDSLLNWEELSTEATKSRTENSEVSEFEIKDSNTALKSEDSQGKESEGKNEISDLGDEDSEDKASDSDFQDKDSEVTESISEETTEFTPGTKFIISKKLTVDSPKNALVSSTEAQSVLLSSTEVQPVIKSSTEAQSTTQSFTEEQNVISTSTEAYNVQQSSTDATTTRTTFETSTRFPYNSEVQASTDDSVNLETTEVVSKASTVSLMPVVKPTVSSEAANTLTINSKSSTPLSGLPKPKSPLTNAKISSQQSQNQYIDISLITNNKPTSIDQYEIPSTLEYNELLAKTLASTEAYSIQNGDILALETKIDDIELLDFPVAVKEVWNSDSDVNVDDMPAAFPPSKFILTSGGF